MKKFIYPITLIFFLQTTLSSVVWADNQTSVAVPEAEQIGTKLAMEYGISPATSQARFAEIVKLRNEKPYSSLFIPESFCAGKENLLNSFINEVPKTDGNGNETAERIKGSLFEKELELGERNFDFERLENFRFSEKNDPMTQVCLDVFRTQAVNEWASYFEDRSEQFGCGLKFAADAQGRFKVESPNVRSATCDIPFSNTKLYDFYKAQMEKLTDVVNSYEAKYNDEYKKLIEADSEQAKTQAGICTDPANCQTGSNDSTQVGKGFEKFSKEWCCERVSERFEALGFTSLKDVKPNERVCHDMLDKESDEGYCDGRFCTKTIGDCLKNFANVFLKEAFASFADFFSFGWITQLATMVKEITSNPEEAATNIVKNMFGFDGDYMGCLNKKSQSQYVCQMIGKFAGSSAGFSAGLGGIIGLARVGKGIVIGKLAKDSTAKTIRPTLKDAAKTGGRAFLTGAAWPYYATRGVLSGTKSVIKGTWKRTPFAINRATKAVISAPSEVTGRLLQGTGRVFFKDNSPEVLAVRNLVDEAAAVKLQKAKDIRAGNKPKSTVDGKSVDYDAQIKQSESVVKMLDDQLAELEKLKTKQMEGLTIFNGKPRFKNPSQHAEFMKTEEKIRMLKETKTKFNEDMDGLKKERATELEKLETTTNASKAKTYKNIKGVGLGVGAAGSMYPVDSSKTEKKTKPDPGPKGAKTAPAVQGVGTGEGIPGVTAPKPAGTVPAAPQPAAGASENEAPPTMPPVE